MAVYGDVLNAFPELMQSIDVWTRHDMSDVRRIKGAFLPTRGDRFMRQKYTSRGSAYQYFEDDRLFVGRHWLDRIHTGDFFRDPIEGHIHRICGVVNLHHIGGYAAFITERVTGANCEQTDELAVKEPSFA